MHLALRGTCIILSVLYILTSCTVLRRTATLGRPHRETAADVRPWAGCPHRGRCECVPLLKSAASDWPNALQAHAMAQYQGSGAGQAFEVRYR